VSWEALVELIETTIRADMGSGRYLLSAVVLAIESAGRIPVVSALNRTLSDQLNRGRAAAPPPVGCESASTPCDTECSGAGLATFDPRHDGIACTQRATFSHSRERSGWGSAIFAAVVPSRFSTRLGSGPHWAPYSQFVDASTPLETLPRYGPRGWPKSAPLVLALVTRQARSCSASGPLRSDGSSAGSDRDWTSPSPQRDETPAPARAPASELSESVAVNLAAGVRYGRAR